MRFSYIDSQGKEIEVDSVESLALRIELGAIQPGTRMYDAVADRWAPAEEHPVFRSLSRGEEVTEEDVIPIGAEGGAAAPPAEPPAKPESSPEPPPEAEAEPTTEPEPAAATEAEPEPSAEPPPPAEPEPTTEPEPAAASGDDPLGLDFQVSMPGEEEEDRAAEPADVVDADAPSPQDEGAVEAQPEDEPEVVPAESTGFGDFGSVELDEPLAGDAELEDEEEVEEPASEVSEDPWPGGPAEAAVWGDEPEADAEPDDEAAVMPEDDPDSRRLPAWARDAEPWEGGAAAPSRLVRAEEKEAVRKREAEEARKEAPRPAHWDGRRLDAVRKKKTRLRMTVVAGVVVLAAAGAAYVTDFGGLLGGDGEAEGTEPEPLSPAAVAVMGEAVSGAWGAAVESVRADLTAVDVAPRPPEAWLEGIYLSTAGDHPGVASYWEGMSQAIVTARQTLEFTFRSQLGAELREAGGPAGASAAGGGENGALGPGEIERVRARALERWEESKPTRDSVFGPFLELTEASLDLHALLVQRQDDITYEPFSSPGVSRDPILEAVPSDSVLKAEMNAHLDRILKAMADSGIPRPITTRGIMDHLLAALPSAAPR